MFLRPRTTTSRWQWVLTSAAFIIAGTTVLLIAYWWAGEFINLQRIGKETQATVIETEQTDIRNRHVTVEFTLDSGESVIVTREVGATLYGQLHEGDTTLVVYDPQNPQNAQLAEHSFWQEISCASIGLLLLVFGLFHSALMIRKWSSLT